MAMYYPMVSKRTLTPSNPSYTSLVGAIDDFKRAQDAYWDSRKAYWQTQGITRSRSSIVDRYESKVGVGDPWTWRTLFSRLNPNRDVDFRNQFYVFVDSSYPGRVELFDEFLQPLVPRLYAAQMQNGNPEEDVLWTNIDKFNGKGDATTYYIDFGGAALAVDVYSAYDTTPYAFEAVPGYDQQALQIMNLIAEGWRGNCNTERLAYDSAFASYNLNQGGRYDEDYFSGNPDRPWNGYEGDPNYSYMRPDDLPIPLRREIRGNA